MFAVLTKYLFQFKRVVIPNIGGLEIMTKPAQLEFAKRKLYPPTHSIHFFNATYADKHQIDYMAASLKLDEPAAVAQLNAFGAALKEKIAQQPFSWNGIGLFVFSNGELSFDPETLPLTALEPVEANRIIRENPGHSVLIGEKEIHSHDARALLQTAEEERSESTVSTSGRNYRIITGWVLVFLAALFILFYLYNNGFRVAASGNKNSIQIKTPEPTYR